jgi:dihydrolipoamide dehydrogenase
MVVGELADQADLLVIGGGPGGYSAALSAAQLGRSVTLIQRGGSPALGGTCLHVGCIPSKALIEVAARRNSALEAAPFGLTGGPLTLDLAAFQKWQSGMIGTLASGIAGLLRERGITVLDGTARFINPHKVIVEEPDDRVRYIQFTDVIIATGSVPMAVPGIPFDGEIILSSTELLALTDLPRSLVVVGAGYIGIELGTAMAKLGVDVTIVEASERILPSCPAGVVAPVESRLTALGVTVLAHSTLRQAQNGLTVTTPAGERKIPGDLVLAAVGREPCTSDLGLDRAGLTVLPSGHIPVDSSMRASEHIAAIGDVVQGPALAHRASAHAEVAARSLSGIPSVFDSVVPVVVFSDPEIAIVGMTDDEVKGAGISAVTATFSMRASGRSATLGRQEGFVRALASRDDDRMLGVQIVAPHASELASEAALAIEMRTSPLDVALTVHPHPTVSESVSDVAKALMQRASNRANANHPVHKSGRPSSIRSAP